MSSSISSFSGSESFCECSSCKYKLVEPFPCYPTLCAPLVYFAEMRHGKEQKQKQENKRNLFLRAFHWYTEEHRAHNSTATTSTSEVKETSTSKKDDDVSAFANWLDIKYQQFLQQKPESSNIVVTANTLVCEQVIQQSDMCNPSITKKKLSKFTKCRHDCEAYAPDGGQTNSMEYILEPKNMSHVVSVCCHPVPTSNPSMNIGARSKIEDEINPAKIENPSMEQKADVAKPLVAQKSYVIEPASELKAHNEFANEGKEENLKTPLKEPRTVAYSSATEATNAVNSKEENRKTFSKEPSTVEHSSTTKTANEEMLKAASKEPSNVAQSTKNQKHNNVTCQCKTKSAQLQPLSNTPSLTQVKIDEKFKGEVVKKSEVSTQYVTESKEVQIQYQEQPVPISWPAPTYLGQNLCPSFQKPCPSFAKLACGQTNPCPSLLQPCPGKRPCPTLHGSCFLPPLNIDKTVTERQPSQNTKDVLDSPSKSEPPVNRARSPSFQKPTSNICKATFKLATPCPSLQQACPAFRQCLTLRGPCLNPNEINDASSQQQPPQNLRSSQESSSKPYQPMNPKPCPTFYEPCPSFYKPLSGTVEPCPSLQQPYPPDHRHGQCFYNSPKINTAVLQLQSQVVQRDVRESCLTSEQPVNQRICPTYNGPCPSFYNTAAGPVTPSPNLPQYDRPQYPGLYAPIEPRFIHYGNNCMCQGTIPPPQLIRREICLQRFCKRCGDNCGTNAVNENVARPSALVPQYAVVGQCSVERDIKITTKTECTPAVSEGVSTKPSSVDLACQTSDHSIRLDKETMGSDYPFFMKIVCADRLKQ